MHHFKAETFLAWTFRARTFGASRVPTRSGEEYTLPTSRLHFDLIGSPLHYRLNGSPLHYTIPDENN